MARSHYTIAAKNPNPRGACLCSPSKLQDCVGPFIVFGPGVEMQDPRQPHPVLSIECACAAVRKVGKRSDAPDCAKPPKPAPPAEVITVTDLAGATAAELMNALADHVAGVK